MTQYAGRNLKIKDGGVAIAGIRTKSMSIGSAEIDVTTDDDEGFRKLLSTADDSDFEVGQKQIDVSFDGITDDDTLIKAAADKDTTVKYASLVLEFGSGATITGDFMFTNMEITGEYQGSQEFSGELKSSGEWTWADAP